MKIISKRRIIDNNKERDHLKKRFLKHNNKKNQNESKQNLGYKKNHY